MSEHPIHRFPKLQRFVETATPEASDAALRALDSGAPAERIAGVLARHGHPVSASTIRTYRRALRAWKEGRDQ